MTQRKQGRPPAKEPVKNGRTIQIVVRPPSMVDLIDKAAANESTTRNDIIQAGIVSEMQRRDLWPKAGK